MDLNLTADAETWPEWLTTADAARVLHLSEQMVRIHLNSGALKGRKFDGRTWVIKPADLEEFAKKPRPSGWPRGKPRKTGAETGAKNP